ncbi:hypothetical protein [Desulfovibrio sp. JC010]|uniref:hypothetical protein n=1 Tax=Desulfovibrio sp. JC010 TaxID=2593641 RepID=UPI0013D77750|nr:hypothetical protein [Desulfovibrio sp. JC010]NDV28194.1 hypothetical protein [Desulfovibrio sp. JC010]
MKYVCKKDCYVKNPQGRLQLFKVGMSVDYAAGAEVAEHFELADGEKGKAEAKKKTVRSRKKEAEDK